jgi:hypothetical protein
MKVAIGITVAGLLLGLAVSVVMAAAGDSPSAGAPGRCMLGA